MAADANIIRVIEAILKKLFLLIGRGIVKQVNASGKVQRIQITGVKGEIISDMERMQNYGFESYPSTEMEATTLFFNGNRDQGVVICVTDRAVKPITLSENDVLVYDKHGNTIHCKSTGIVATDKNGNVVELKAGMVDINGNLTVEI